jgi:hypothetical protein
LLVGLQLMGTAAAAAAAAGAGACTDVSQCHAIRCIRPKFWHLEGSSAGFASAVVVWTSCSAGFASAVVVSTTAIFAVASFLCVVLLLTWQL